MSELSRGASKEAIEHHYDLSNEFYELWLDSTMSYSSAKWGPGDSLDDAQIRKIDHHIEASNANLCCNVLDVGCGWGGALNRLVRHHNVRKATGLTLSTAQQEWILKMEIPGVEIKLESWHDHIPTEPYDAMISIGAFEHFARLDDSDEQRLAKYTSFFEWCNQWLQSESRLSLQTFAYGRCVSQTEVHDSRGTRFLSAEIFRETDPPRLDEIIRASSHYFEIENASNDRLGYARTCKAWLSRLRERGADARELVGEDIYDRYRRYLQLSTLAFESGRLELWRLQFRRRSP